MLLASIGWLAEGNPAAFSRVAKAMGGDDPVLGFDRIVRASGIAVAPGVADVTPQALAARRAAPAKTQMRKPTLRYPTDGELVMLAERFLSLA